MDLSATFTLVRPRLRLALRLLLASLLLPVPTLAEEPLGALLGAPLAAAQLAEVRGGFSQGGLQLEFALERSTLVDGELQTRTLLYPAAGGLAPLPLILQNSQDYRQLQALTRLDVRLSGFDPVEAARFETLSGAQHLNLRR